MKFSNNQYITRISTISKYLLYALLIAGFIFVIFTIGKNNLSNENLWFDESGQFWMAKGLNHYSPPLSKEGSIVDVIRQNASMNLDPGGFTILLHFWTKISNSIYWLRLLPYIFYIFSALTIAIITYQFSSSVGLSLLSLYLLPAMRGDLLYYAFEVRAYSMEYFGIALSIALFLNYIKRKSNRKLLVLTSTLAIFCTSRYSFIVFAFIISVVVLLTLKNKIKNLKYFFPIFLTLILIYIFSYRNQVHGLNSPDYTSRYLFKNLSKAEIIESIKINLFSPNGIFQSLVSIAGLLILFYSNIKRKRNLLFVSLIVTLYSTSFFILSLSGVHPWLVNIRWNISFQMTNLICLSILIGFVLNSLRAENNKFEIYAPLFFLLIVLLGNKYLYRYLKNVGHYFRVSPSSISANYKALNISDSAIFYISKSDIPSWKYLFEYGSLRNINYPKNTYFESNGNLMPKSVNYVIQSNHEEELITSGSFEDVTVYQPTRFLYVKVK